MDRRADARKYVAARASHELRREPPIRLDDHDRATAQAAGGSAAVSGDAGLREARVAHVSAPSGGDELLAAEHALELLAADEVVQLLDARVRRVAGELLDAEVALRDARDLREVRDREHLRALGEALQRRRDGVRRDAADAGVDLVEDERLAARDGRERERDPRELAARCRLGDRAEREARRSGG